MRQESELTGRIPARERTGRWAREFPLRRVVAEDGSVLGDPREIVLADAEVRTLYRWMLLERVLDERMVTLQRQGRIGFYIGSIGEEATVYGAAAAMEERDWLFPCYREHGGALLRGMPLVTFICDLLGNAGDAMKGRQMPCHEAWRPGRFASISSPIATQIPQAVGAAWAARIKGDDMVPLVWFGEGATSAADFHTGLNFAAVRKIPVVLVCRNNGWAISVPRERQTGSETIAQKAIAYGMRGERVDGNDLLACVTYRMEGHSTSDDPRAYRAPELVEAWKAKDPLLRMRNYLTRRGALAEGDEARLKEEVRAEIQRAIAEAEAYPPKPPIEALFEDVYAEPLRPQREQLDELREAIAADPRVANPRHSDA